MNNKVYQLNDCVKAKPNGYDYYIDSKIYKVKHFYDKGEFKSVYDVSHYLNGYMFVYGDVSEEYICDPETKTEVFPITEN